MTLPASRNRTYVAGVSEVFADDLNAFQDYIIALAGPRTIDLGPDYLIPQTAADWGLADQGEAGSSGGTGLLRSLAGTTTSKVYCYLPLSVGDRLVSYKLSLLEPDTAHRTTVILQRITLGNGLSNEFGDAPATTPSTGGPGMTTVALAAINRTLAARERLQLCITTTKVGVHLFGVEIVVDHAV